MNFESHFCYTTHCNTSTNTYIVRTYVGKHAISYNFIHFSEVPTWRGSYEASRVFCTYDLYDCTLKCLNNLLRSRKYTFIQFSSKNLNGIFIRLFSWRNEKWNNRHAILNGSDYSQPEYNIYNIQWIYFIIFCLQESLKCTYRRRWWQGKAYSGPTNRGSNW